MEKIEIKKPTPMMQHYWTIKNKYKDAVVFYRLGDFYEMFYDDAIECSRVLDLTLTGKSCGLEERAPMCGVPYHAADTYIKKLIDNNYKVAICEQLTEHQKGEIVERDVVRVVTPGTIIEDSMLEEKKNNYIASVYVNNNQIGVTYSDISTGEFYVTEFIDDEAVSNLNDILLRIMPSEIIANEQTMALCPYLTVCKSQILPKFENQPEWTFELKRSTDNLKQQFGQNCLTVFEIKNMQNTICSSGALLEYLKQTQKRALVHINKITKVVNSDFMILDSTARRNLEINETIRDRKKKGSLLWLLDDTKTGMGSRMFKSWIDQPLNNVNLINQRLNSVEELISKVIIRDKLTQCLARVYDIERLVSRVASERFTPRDCNSLKDSLLKLPEIKTLLADFKSKMIKNLENNFVDLSDIADLIEKTIISEPPNNLKDGGYIKEGLNDELDEYKSALTNGKDWITKLEIKEREATGIKTLKIAYNRVFGYFIEVSKTNIVNVPMRYVRKQTLSNNERYITDELKEIEDKVLNAEDLSIKLEQKIFADLKSKLIEMIPKFQQVAKTIATLDSLISLARVSVKYNYCKPIINEKITHIKIEQGRHPVVEAILKNDQFIANDTFLDDDKDKIMIITGPNMAGKSTYMRQVAIITLMAHIGCFVPAKYAEISLTDRIFTRVGASDDLAFGQSTFMVEMSEVANILQNATNKSLIVLDEIGRGTSTFDGLSIAWAVVEYLAKNLCAKTLFATHYHELTELECFLEGVKNYKVSIKEYNNTIIFLRKIVRGGANKSFGIEVASLAGVPDSIIERSREISKKLEETGNNRSIAIESSENTEKVITQNKNYLDIISIIKDINMEKISPMSAFEILNDLVDKIRG